MAKGLADLAGGRTTVESLLIGCASIRLRKLGLAVPGPVVGIEQSLYRLIEEEVGEARAHSRYNALRRRLVSFLGSARDAARG